MLSEIVDILRSNGQALAEYDSGTVLFARGDDVKSVFLLERGEIKLSRFLEDGKELVLHRARGPGILAEASIYSATYHCDAVCLSQCTLRTVPIFQFLSLIEERAQMSSIWSAHLAHNLQAARFRNEILTMKKVCDRLDAWIDWRDGDFPPKGQWKEVAAEIGVSPEALYRELARRAP